MTSKRTKIELLEPDDQFHTWSLVYEPIPPDEEDGSPICGLVDWETRTITINSRMASRDDKMYTAFHEAGYHVAGLRVVSEWLAEAGEGNSRTTWEALKKLMRRK